MEARSENAEVQRFQQHPSVSLCSTFPIVNIYLYNYLKSLLIFRLYVPMKTGMVDFIYLYINSVWLIIGAQKIGTD